MVPTVPLDGVGDRRRQQVGDLVDDAAEIRQAHESLGGRGWS